MLPELLLIIALVLVNAVLSGSELALISLRGPQLAQMTERGGGARIAADLARDHNRFLATIQIGITLAGFMASAVAAVSLAEPLFGLFEVFGDAGETLAVVAVTVVLAFITLVFGELVPKRLALLHPVGWATAFGRILNWTAIVATPVVWLLSVTTDLFVRVLGGPARDRESTEELAELREMVVMAGSLEYGHDELLRSAVDVADRSVVGVMTPRLDVVSVPADASVGDAIETMTNGGFTRIPLLDRSGSLDESPGIVTMQDIVDAARTNAVADHVRPVPAFPESTKVLAALRSMQTERAPMAYVIDEFGGVEGIMTVEDLIEELVGEIYDDVDVTVEQPEALGDGSIAVPGRFPIHDLAEFGIDVPQGDYATVAGLVLQAFEEIPEKGDRVRVGDWMVEVDAMNELNVDLVRFRPADGQVD